MTTLRAAAQQALEALEYHQEQTRPIWRTTEAIEALEAALAEPEPPPEAQTDAEKLAYCAGWWDALAKARKAALAENFCDTNCTWADHAPGCVRAEPVEPVAWSHINGTSDTKWYPPQRKPLTVNEKITLVRNWFAEDWSIKNAIGLLEDYERAIDAARSKT